MSPSAAALLKKSSPIKFLIFSCTAGCCSVNGFCHSNNSSALAPNWSALAKTSGLRGVDISNATFFALRSSAACDTVMPRFLAAALSMSSSMRPISCFAFSAHILSISSLVIFARSPLMLISVSRRGFSVNGIKSKFSSIIPVSSGRTEACLSDSKFLRILETVSSLDFDRAGFPN